MRRDTQHPGWWLILASVFAGLVLAVIPLPDAIDPLRPDWLLLLVIYWSLRAPRSIGLAFATACGLALDVTKGTTLGQYGLGFLVAGFLTHRMQLRMRNFPITHQALTVLMLLGLYQFLIFWIDGITGNAVTHWERWLPIVTGTLLWPVLVGVMDGLARRRR
ncbi:MAG TPA: rod shape-determining protein MreD [Steroidobacteraceae bacterium]|nr:rod shape-determining protein MreD [Steroidobacteraceae bacterium]